MFLNLALLFVLGLVYELVIDPGHPQAYYAAIYPKIGAWSAPAGAMLLLFLATWGFGVRRPQRKAGLFGAAVYLSYFGVDAALGLASGPPGRLLVPSFFV